MIFSAMKKVFILFASAALLFNIVSLILWLNSYWTTNTHLQAVAKFENYFHAVYSTRTFYAVSILATILSMVVLTWYKTARHHTIFAGLIVIQAAFLLLFTWQLL